MVKGQPSIPVAIIQRARLGKEEGLDFSESHSRVSVGAFKRLIAHISISSFSRDRRAGRSLAFFGDCFPHTVRPVGVLDDEQAFVLGAGP